MAWGLASESDGESWASRKGDPVSEVEADILGRHRNFVVQHGVAPKKGEADAGHFGCRVPEESQVGLISEADAGGDPGRHWHRVGRSGYGHRVGSQTRGLRRRSRRTCRRRARRARRRARGRAAAPEPRRCRHPRCRRAASPGRAAPGSRARSRARPWRRFRAGPRTRSSSRARQGRRCRGICKALHYMGEIIQYDAEKNARVERALRGLTDLVENDDVEREDDVVEECRGPQRRAEPERAHDACLAHEHVARGAERRVAAVPPQRLEEQEAQEDEALEPVGGPR
mmetsp:Transcript_14871/g.52979  ORF Transcript_14871/g.52979 Transcript_14871/m.52979 type:complete len:285 (+) Transcript_14871:288-1142(+)